MASLLYSAVFSGLLPTSSESFLSIPFILGLPPACRCGQTCFRWINTPLPRPQRAVRVLSSHRCALSFQITETHEAVYPFSISAFGNFLPQSTKFQTDNLLYYLTLCNSYLPLRLILTLCIICKLACNQSLQKSHTEQDSPWEHAASSSQMNRLPACKLEATANRLGPHPQLGEPVGFTLLLDFYKFHFPPEVSKLQNYVA